MSCVVRFWIAEHPYNYVYCCLIIILSKIWEMCLKVNFKISIYAKKNYKTSLIRVFSGVIKYFENLSNNAKL